MKMLNILKVLQENPEHFECVAILSTKLGKWNTSITEAIDLWKNFNTLQLFCFSCITVHVWLQMDLNVREMSPLVLYGLADVGWSYWNTWLFFLEITLAQNWAETKHLVAELVMNSSVKILINK